MLHPGCVLHSLVCSTPLWLCAVSIHLTIKNTGKVISAGTLVGCWKSACHWQDHSCIPKAERCCLPHTGAGNRKIYTAWYAPAGHSGTCISSQLGPTASGISVGARMKSWGKKIMLGTAFNTQHVKSSPCSPLQHQLKPPPIQQTHCMIFGTWWGGRFLFCLWIFFFTEVYI